MKALTGCFQLSCPWARSSLCLDPQSNSFTLCLGTAIRGLGWALLRFSGPHRVRTGILGRLFDLTSNRSRLADHHCVRWPMGTGRRGGHCPGVTQAVRTELSRQAHVLGAFILGIRQWGVQGAWKLKMKIALGVCVFVCVNKSLPGSMMLPAETDLAEKNIALVSLLV